MKYLRRFMVFISTRLIIITLCAALLVCAFYMAFNIGNAYIVINEGLEKRVDVCLTRDDYVALNKYFTVDFLNNDPVLAVSVSDNSPYLPYTITSYEYDIKLNTLFAWPWDSVIKCTVTESVTEITGNVKAAYAETASAMPPSWSSGRFTVYLTKQEDGSFKISGLAQDAGYRDTGA